MAASSVGNIWIGLNVDTRGTRAFTSAANMVQRDSDRMRQALGGTGRSVSALRATMSQSWRSRIFSDMIRQASLANNEVAQLRASMLALTALTGTSVTGAFAATFILQTADSYNRLNNQLRTVTDSEENRIAVMQRLFRLSQDTRSDMQATITMYARISRAAESFGKSQEDILRVTETVQKAFAIGGASQAEAQGAAIQLSQGIASDRFSGEEYRSVAENAPVLLQEMARYLDVNIGKLREMAHAGELTGKVVTDAILGASAAIDEDFGKTVSTVGQGLQRVGNAFLMYVGETDSSVGATRRLAQALANLADNFDEIAPWITGAAFAGAAIFGGRAAGGALGGMAASLMASTKAARENAAAVMSGNAVALSSAKANELRTRTIRDAAAAEVTATQAKVSSGQADVAALRQSLALTQAQRARAVAQTELNKGVLEATGRVGPYNAALDQQNASTKALLATKRALAVAEKTLVADTAALRTQVSAATVATAAHNAALANTTVRARAAAASLSAMRVAGGLAARAVGGLMGALGGPAGIAITAAIVGIGMYAANAAKAQERTAKLTSELHALGLISDEVAGVVSDAADSLDDLGAAAVRNKLREIADEMQRIKGEQNIFDQMFFYDPKMLGNMLDQLSSIRSRGSSTVGADRSAALELEQIVLAARDGTDTVEGLQERLDSLAESNPDMAGWLDRMIENLKLTIPYMDGLQTRAEQLDAKLRELGATGVSSAWVDNLIAQQEAMEAAQAGADAIRAYTDEQVRSLGLSEEEAALERIKLGIRKELKDAIEEGLVVQEYALDAAAREILASERAKEAREAAAKAQEDFNEKVAELSAEIDDATSSFEDMQAAATIKRLLTDFATGTMKAETLKNRLAEINSVNLSDPMDTLIAKIVAAIGPLATLLGLFNSFGGSPLGGDLPGPARPGGALGRSRRELAAKQAIGQGVLDGAVADAGMSERDAWIKDKAQDLKDQAAALGGVATGAEATAAQLWEMDQAQRAAETSGKAAADAAEKYAEGMAELQREVAAAPLDPFLKEVLASAEGMGIATEELDAFVAAVSSGGLDAAPEKFKAIARAMQEIKAVGILQDLQFEAEQLMRSPGERQVAETLRDIGLTENDPYGALIAGQIRYNNLLEAGSEIARDFFGGILSDIRQGVPLTEALSNAFSRLGDRLLQIALDHAINSLFSNLVGGLLGGGNPFSFGLGGAGFLGGGQSAWGGLIPGNANGTDFWRGGLTQINERGGEILDLPRGTRIIPHDVSVKALAAAASQREDRRNIQVTVAWDEDGSGNIAPIIKSVADRAIRDAEPSIVKSSLKATKALLPSAVADSQRRQG